MKDFKKFIAYYKPYKFLFYFDMFCALTLSLIDLAFPLIVRYLLNDVYVLNEGSRILKFVIYIGISLLGMYIIRYFCQYYITSWGHIMGARMEADMRKDLFDHLQKMSFSFYDENNTGTLMSRIVSDLFDISELAHHGPEDLFISILKIAGSLIILFVINVKMTAILMIFLILMLIFSFFYNSKMRKVFMENRKKIADVNAQVQDSLSGIRVVKSFANESIESTKFDKSNIEFTKSKEDNYYVMGKFYSGNGLFQGMLYLSVIISGGVFISLHSVNISDLVIYLLYINIFLNPIDKLVNFTEQFQRGASGFTRFLEIINVHPDIEDKQDAVEIKKLKGDIEFNNVSFSYNEKHNVLSNINIKIPAGKNIALVGPSGGGKSTFCSLITRFYEINEGKITIAGLDIRDLKLKSLRNSIGVVQQDVYMFGGNIRENISYGKPDATEEEIIEAAKNANIHD
ncbi:MAG: ABC transporter ATP-binding protein, partial [Bacillota bacterium]|nr:ABC transporter ATP-binding protein [Bacillota bacterium]